MANIRLTEDNVRLILCRLLDEQEYWDLKDAASDQLCYIAGMKDMANAVIEAIKVVRGD